MSFWSYLLAKKYAECKIDSDFCALVEFNGQTHNTGALWKKALNGTHLSDFEGCAAKEMLPIVQSAIKWIERNPEDFKHLEAENGWGTIGSALRYLKALEKGCAEYPESFYHWSG